MPEPLAPRNRQGCYAVPYWTITGRGGGGRRAIGTEAQIRSLVAIGRRAGYIESDEGQMIYRAFILNDKTSQDVMTPLKDIVEIKADNHSKVSTNG